MHVVLKVKSGVAVNKTIQMARLRVVRRMLCSAAEAAAAPATASKWDRLKNSKAVSANSSRCYLKNSRISAAPSQRIVCCFTSDLKYVPEEMAKGVWCRSLFSDYKEACREVIVGSWERPVKASLYASLLGGAWACFYSKPDQSSFEETLLERSNQLVLLSPWIRNGTSDNHVQSLVKLRNEGRLRCASLGLLSLIYQADYDHDTTLYEAQCSNLSVPWRELPQRILDVGLVGRWWVLDLKMKDYDVNEKEFTHLPAHMLATSPPSVQEVEKCERLHKESWLALTVEEEEKENSVADIKEESVSEESQIQTLKE